MSQPQPQLAGKQYVDSSNGYVYLVNPEGYYQFIPDVDTYRNLFGGFQEMGEFDPGHIPVGDPITTQAILAKSATDPYEIVFLLTNGVKRMVSADAMTQYGFVPSHVTILPPVPLDFITRGDNWI